LRDQSTTVGLTLSKETHLEERKMTMSVDLVLINPRVVGSDKAPPLSLLCLAAYVRKNGHSVSIIDAQAEELSDDEVRAQVISYKPILCGITFMTSQVGIVRRLIKSLKTEGGPKIVAGGIHASVLPKETIELGFDFCVVGEGEQTLVDLLYALKNKSSLEINGLWSERFRPREFINDLDTLPMPAWDLVPTKKYEVSQPDLRYEMEPGVCMTISTSRGCLYSCSFCSSHGVFAHTHRDRSPSNVVDEIEMLYRKYGIAKFFLVDESILGNKKRAEKLAQEILERGLNVRFASSARVTDPGVNVDTLRKLRKAGMVRVDFGVESGSRCILKDIRKGITAESVIEAHRIAHEAGMTTCSLMIAGHLEEDWEDVYDSLELIANIETEFCEFGPLTPYPGTEVYRKAAKEGWIRNFDWDMYYISNPYRVMRSRCFSYQEIYMLGLMCTDAARFMINWKKKKGRSWHDFYSTLKSSCIGLKPIGRYWLAKYMITRDREFLRRLSFKQLKWRPPNFKHPEDASLLVGIRRNPMSIFKKENKKRLFKLLPPLLLNRLKESIAALLYQTIYAFKLVKFVKTTSSQTKELEIFAQPEIEVPAEAHQ
jgi:radical SAM superfamily enzyme YgiQ (UPF0313 family)